MEDTARRYSDWLGPFRTNIVTQKADRIHLKPSFHAMKNLFWAYSCLIGGALWVVRESQNPLVIMGVSLVGILTGWDSLEPIL